MSSPVSPSIAIATGILGVATETGVRRHINHLFRENTVVISERAESSYSAKRPVFLINDASRQTGSPVEREIGKLIQSLRFSCSAVPFGRNAQALRQFLDDHRVAAILAEFGHIGCVMAPIGQQLGIPVFTYFRGFDASKQLRKKRIIRRYRAAAPRLSGFVSVSQFLLDNLAAKGITHPNSHVIPTGVDMEKFAPAEKDPNLILAVGRIMDKKAPLVSINAFAGIAADFPDHRLEVIGDGPLKAECEAHVQALGLAKRVSFHGRQPHDVVRAKLAQAAVFLQHSVTAPDGNTEGLPTSIQEAMASGAVVVSTRHAGIPEAITDGVHGALSEEHDLQGFTAALRYVIEDEARAHQFAEAARKRAVEDFDFRKLHKKLEDLICAECARMGRPAPAYGDVGEA